MSNANAGAAQFDDNFDWSTGQDHANGGAPAVPTGGAYGEFGGPDPAQPLDADSFEFAPIAPVNTAEEIEQNSAAREYRKIPLGEHLLVVAGFHGYPEAKNRTGYFNGQFVSWTSYSVGVRLAMAADPQATMLDFFDLPPVDPRETQFYQRASSKPDGKNPGFFAEKFTHFISRLGWPFPKGAPIPVEACRIGNWKGREIIGTIEMGKVNTKKLDPTTLLPYPAREQVKLFSYRPAESTVMGYAGQAGGQAAHQAAGQPQGQGPRPAAHPGVGGQGQPQARPQGAPQGYPQGQQVMGGQAQRPQGPQAGAPGQSFSNRGLANI